MTSLRVSAAEVSWLVIVHGEVVLSPLTLFLSPRNTGWITFLSVTIYLIFFFFSTRPLLNSFHCHPVFPLWPPIKLYYMDVCYCRQAHDRTETLLSVWSAVLNVSHCYLCCHSSWPQFFQTQRLEKALKDTVLLIRTIQNTSLFLAKQQGRPLC